MQYPSVVQHSSPHLSSPHRQDAGDARVVKRAMPPRLRVAGDAEVRDSSAGSAKRAEPQAPAARMEPAAEGAKGAKDAMGVKDAKAAAPSNDEFGREAAMMISAVLENRIASPGALVDEIEARILQVPAKDAKGSPASSTVVDLASLDSASYGFVDELLEHAPFKALLGARLERLPPCTCFVLRLDKDACEDRPARWPTASARTAWPVTAELRADMVGRVSKLMNARPEQIASITDAFLSGFGTVQTAESPPRTICFVDLKPLRDAVEARAGMEVADDVVHDFEDGIDQLVGSPNGAPWCAGFKQARLLVPVEDLQGAGGIAAPSVEPSAEPAAKPGVAPGSMDRKEPAPDDGAALMTFVLRAESLIAEGYPNEAPGTAHVVAERLAGCFVRPLLDHGLAPHALLDLTRLDRHSYDLIQGMLTLPHFRKLVHERASELAEGMKSVGCSVHWLSERNCFFPIPWPEDCWFAVHPQAREHPELLKRLDALVTALRVDAKLESDVREAILRNIGTIATPRGPIHCVDLVECCALLDRAGRDRAPRLRARLLQHTRAMIGGAGACARWDEDFGPTRVVLPGLGIF